MNSTNLMLVGFIAALYAVAAYSLPKGHENPYLQKENPRPSPELLRTYDLVNWFILSTLFASLLISFLIARLTGIEPQFRVVGWMLFVLVGVVPLITLLILRNTNRPAFDLFRRGQFGGSRGKEIFTVLVWILAALLGPYYFWNFKF